MVKNSLIMNFNGTFFIHITNDILYSNTFVDTQKYG